MKRIIYKNTLAVLALAWAVCGCEDFLNEQPQSDFTRPESSSGSELTSAYETVEEAQNELNGAYANFKADIYEMNNFLVADVMSDNCYVGGDGINEEQFDLMNLTATNTMVALSWSQYYTLAGSATTVIENVKLMPEDPETEQQKNQIIAEAKFIRAWAYFDIVRLWGDAPMTLQLIPAITSDNLDEWYPVMYPEKTPAADIYKQILEDLDDEDVIQYLPSMSHGAFQATKGAAYGLRAKVYATMGEKADRNWQAVVDECDKVIGEGYELVPNFDDLWTVSGKFSNESIFELYFTSENEQHNWAYWVLLSDVNGDVVVSWRRYCTPTQELVEKFDAENDTRYASSIYWTEVPYNTYWPASNYPLSYKIRQEENDIILLRLADILLLKAEALVELNRTEEAINIVNEIRERAGIDDLDTGMGQEEARLAVENERQLELYMEGQRWFDLVRNDRMEAVIRAHKNKDGEPMVSDVSEFRRLLPIPQAQIDINERLTQNPGY